MAVGLKVKLAALAIGVAVSSVALAWNEAGGEKEEALHLKGNPKAGRDVFEVCSACHMPNGWGRQDGTFPQLAGQHANVLIKQLADIRDGNRDNPTMYPFAKADQIGGPQALADVVAYIETLPMNPQNGKGPGTDLALGEKLFKENCVRCHGDRGQGNNAKFFPRIQGQQYNYIVRQFREIKAAKRRNANPDMIKQVKNFTERDLLAVCDYVSRIKPPKEKLAPIGWQNPDFK